MKNKKGKAKLKHKRGGTKARSFQLLVPKMESSRVATTRSWTEKVEDLVHGGEDGQAIAFLESTVSNLEGQLVNDKNGVTSPSSIVDQLATALQDLSKLYSARGFSLKADQTFSRALQIKYGKG